MNKNEECLLKFLKQPERLDKTTEELNRFIFSAKNNMTNPVKKGIEKKIPAMIDA